MFIEAASPKRLSSLQRSETSGGRYVTFPLPETLRSAGARIIEFVALFYKHLAPTGAKTNPLIGFQKPEPSIILARSTFDI
jgi:hypothetical protein